MVIQAAILRSQAPGWVPALKQCTEFGLVADRKKSVKLASGCNSLAGDLAGIIDRLSSDQMREWRVLLDQGFHVDRKLCLPTRGQ